MNDAELLRVALTVIGGLILFLASVFAWWASRITNKLDEIVNQRLDCADRFADARKNAETHRRLWEALGQWDIALADARADARARAQGKTAFFPQHEGGVCVATQRESDLEHLRSGKRCKFQREEE